MTQMLTRPIQDNRILQETADLRVGLGEGLGAVWQTPGWYGLEKQAREQLAVSSEIVVPELLERGQEFISKRDELGRELEAAEFEGAPETDIDDILSRLDALKKAHNLTLDTETQRAIDDGRMRSPDDLNAEYGEWDLKFDRPMSTKEAKRIYDSKRAEVIRNAIIQRSPSGVLPTAAKFGVGLAAMAVDPLEFASMFIPVVGPARKAMWVEKFGRVGGRVAAGATEGLVGSALTEPLYYSLSKQQQLDYTMADALLNIGLGFALGGSIGAAGGLLARRGDAPQVDAPKMETDGPRIELETPPKKVVVPDKIPTQVEVTAARQNADIALRQFVNDQAVDVGSYRGEHTAPTRSADNAPSHALNEIYPDDIYSTKARLYYGTGDDKADRETLRILKAIRGKPDAEVVVFRAVPKGVADINAGDWVSVNKDYTIGHGEGPMYGDYDLISKTVKADDLHTDANSIHEFGYNPRKVPRTDYRGNKVSSWVAVDKDTGKGVAEIQTASVADKLNFKKYSAVPISEYLGDINQAIKRGDDPTVDAETLARHAQEPSPQSSPELAKAYDDFAREEFTGDPFVQAEIEMNSRMVDQVELTPEQQVRLDEVAEMETKAKAYADISDIAATCMART